MRSESEPQVVPSIAHTWMAFWRMSGALSEWMLGLPSVNLRLGSGPSRWLMSARHRRDRGSGSQRHRISLMSKPPRLALTRRASLERNSVIPAESEGGAAFAVAILASLMLSKNQKVSGPFVVDAGNGSVDAGR